MAISGRFRPPVSGATAAGSIIWRPCKSGQTATYSTSSQRSGSQTKKPTQMTVTPPPVITKSSGSKKPNRLPGLASLGV